MEERRKRRGMRLAAALIAHPLTWVVAVIGAAGCGGSEEGEGRGGTAGSAETQGRGGTDAPWTSELIAELQEMGRRDQEVRTGLGPGLLTDTVFLGRMARTDSAHSRRLRELVERHGWPLTSDVGEEAAEAAFLVVQHTPFTEWQRDMLPLVEEAVRAGELDPQDYALLYDRVQVGQGRPQRYGTQLEQGAEGKLHLEPLEDTAAVDSLRAVLGLPPLDVYFDVLEKATGMTVARPGSGS